MYADTIDTLPAPDFGWNDEPSCAEVFEHVDAAIYTTDAEGWLTYYNEAAADLWGYRPELGRTRWCGSWRIYQLDGTPLPLDRCPMAEAMQQGQEVRGARAVLEQPDGTLIPFMPFPTPLRDASGKVVAGSNLLLPLQALAPLASFDQAEEERGAISPLASGAAWDPDRLTGCMQWALAALADVELAYQLDCERLAGWAGPRTERDRILRQVELRRRRQRQPLHEFLEELDKCLRAVVASCSSVHFPSATPRQALA